MTKICFLRQIGLLFVHNTQIVAHLLCGQQTWHRFTYSIYIQEIFLYAFTVSKLYWTFYYLFVHNIGYTVMFIPMYISKQTLLIS